jgi:hypothetical protein
MLESEVRGVQGDPRRSAWVCGWRTIHRAVVYRFAGQRRPGFTKVNADLVRSSGFEPALDEATWSQLLQDPHMRHRPLTFTGRAAAAPAVAAIAHDPRLDPPVRRPAAGDRQVTAADRMSAELLAQIGLGLWRAGEHNDAARITVDAMNRPERPGVGQQARQAVRERRRQEAFAMKAELGGLGRATVGCHPWRLVDDHDGGVDVA